MKKESRDRILHAYDQIFRVLSCDFARGIRYICSELEKYLKELRHARTRSGLEAALTKEPEPDPDKLDATIDAILLVPYQLRRALPEATREAMQKLPYPRGGRRPLLTPEARKRVCTGIGKLIADGVCLPDAEKRVAQRENVSVRTIQRAWQKRKQSTAIRDN